jgi:hypothetical protein
MRYWEKLLEKEHGGFTIIVDKSWEDIPLRDIFDETCFDLDDYERKIIRGDLDYFILRARVLLNGAEIGEHIVGGFLYEDATEVLTDGMADDVIYGAACEADKWLTKVFEERTIAEYSLNKILDGA